MRLTRGRLGVGLMIPTALLETRGARTERARLWELADLVFPPDAGYRDATARTGRTIPILQLVPR